MTMSQMCLRAMEAAPALGQIAKFQIQSHLQGNASASNLQSHSNYGSAARVTDTAELEGGRLPNLSAATAAKALQTLCCRRLY